MPGRDAREGQVDRPAMPEHVERQLQELQARQERMGLLVTVNRGAAYPLLADDTMAADVESHLRVNEVGGGEGGVTYPITVNRRGSGAAPTQLYAEREGTLVSDQPLAPGSPAVPHDPMTPEQRAAATRAAVRAYADRHIHRDETLEGEEFAGMVTHRPPVVSPAPPGECVYADHPVGRRLEQRAPQGVVTSDDVTRVDQEEEQLRADLAVLQECLPERSEDTEVDAAGRAVPTAAYRSRVENAKRAREALAAKRAAARAEAETPVEEATAPPEAVTKETKHVAAPEHKEGITPPPAAPAPPPGPPSPPTPAR
jgi:hypothetical protein